MVFASEIMEPLSRSFLRLLKKLSVGALSQQFPLNHRFARHLKALNDRGKRQGRRNR
jgi:hypothetical protein